MKKKATIQLVGREENIFLERTQNLPGLNQTDVVEILRQKKTKHPIRQVNISHIKTTRQTGEDTMQAFCMDGTVLNTKAYNAIKDDLQGITPPGGGTATPVTYYTKIKYTWG